MAVVSAPYTATPHGKASWLGLDWPLLLVTIFLAFWGCFTVFSATQPSRTAVYGARVAGSKPATAAQPRGKSSEGVKQAVFVCIGLTLMLAMAFTNYRWLMHSQLWCYAGTLLILALLLLLPRSVAPVINGAKSWISLGPISLQVSEFAKVGILISLAALVTRRQERIGELSTVLLSLLYLAPAVLLIMKQPDFGTTLAVISIWFGILYFAGARLTHLALILGIGILLFAGAWRFHILKPHQTQRLASFIDPEASAESGGYQLRQSLIAIGGGQITGQGYGQGMQNRAEYVPENHTDFIFTVVAEELGFAGAATLVACYLFVLVRSVFLAASVDSYFGVLLCGGFAALFAFHCIINLGMTMRVMPITGVPLPLFSYGGSSFIAFSLCLGLLQSVSRHRR